MHKFFLTLLLSFIIGEINAYDSQAYLVLWSKDGQYVAYQFAEKPKIRFEKDILVVETKEVKVSYDISQYSKMTFENEIATGLRLVGKSSTDFRYDDNNLVFPNLKKGTWLKIFTMGGRMVFESQFMKDGNYVFPMATLSKGIYIVKIGNVSYKIRKK